MQTKYSQKRNCAAAVPVSKLMGLWAIYIFPRLVCLFCCRKVCGPILGIYKSLTDTWMWKLALQFLFWEFIQKMGFLLQCSMSFRFKQCPVCVDRSTLHGYTLFTVKYLKRKSHPSKILKHEGNSRLWMQPLYSKRSKYIAAVISIVAGRFVANLRCLNIILEIFYFYHKLEGISSMVLNKNIRKCCFKVSILTF